MSALRNALHALVDALPEESLEQALAELEGVAQGSALDATDEAGVRRGIGDVAAGRVVSGDDAFARFDALVAARRGTAA